MGKKGVSPILATIIIIFIMMTLVSVIVLFSNNFFKQQKDPAIAASPQYMKLKISIDSATIAGEEVDIIITRTDNEGETIPLKGMRFKFTDNTNGNSYTYDVSNPPTDAGISVPYKITNIDLGTDSVSTINKVSISAITPEGAETQTLDEQEVPFN